MEKTFAIFVTLLVHTVTSCSFTEQLPYKESQQEWTSRIRSNGKNDVNIVFNRDTVEWRNILNETNVITKWRCFMKIRDKYFLKRLSRAGGYLYKCMGIIIRSQSVIQLQWSQMSRLADPAMCSDETLVIDPWLLISFDTIASDFTSCPFSGGYDIRHAGYYSLDVRDSRGYDIGCNLMNIPMRIEFDCLAGEGAIFNFRTKNCVPDLRFNVHQNTVCVASWKNKHHNFVLLRKKNEIKFWCARFNRDGQHQEKMDLFLFSDLACLEDENSDMFVKYMKFDLQKVIYSTICEDEYPQCKDVTCNEFTKLECQKTCGMCNPKRPPGVCYFPKRIQGTYLSNSKIGNKNLTFTGQTLEIENVGKFNCIVFEDSPLRSTKTYTTVSIFENGCRPRYTCIQLKRLGPSALRYSLSQSLVWPVKKERIGANICDTRQFRADGDPVRDLYRSYQKSGKPIVKVGAEIKFINCGINTSYTIRAELPDGSICHGGFYQHCRDASKLRFDFHTCNAFIRPKQDFRCAAIFRTNYWERAILVQNAEDIGDIRCIIFNTLKPYQALVVKSDECDKMSSGFVDSNIRMPIMKLHIRSDVYPCKTIQLPLKDDVISLDTTTSSPTDPIKLNKTMTKPQNIDAKSMNMLTLNFSKIVKSSSGVVGFPYVLLWCFTICLIIYF